MGKNEFKLYIYKEKGIYKERLQMNEDSPIDLGLFGITNAFLKAVENNDDELISRPDYILNKFERNLGILSQSDFSNIPTDPISKVAYCIAENTFHYEKPIVGIGITEAPGKMGYPYLMERIYLTMMVRNWLEPQKEYPDKPSKKFAMLWDMIELIELSDEKTNSLLDKIHSLSKEDQLLEKFRIYFRKALNFRNDQFITKLGTVDIIYSKKVAGDYIYNKENKIFSELYLSKTGLLPLAWAEIIFAVRNDIQAKFCENPTCKTLFGVSRSYSKFCSNKCKDSFHNAKRDTKKEMSISRKRKKVIGLFEGGYSIEQISELTKFNKLDIQQYLKEHNQRIDSKDLKEEVNKKILELLLGKKDGNDAPLIRRLSKLFSKYEASTIKTMYYRVKKENNIK